jgi:hypothetical protein
MPFCVEKKMSMRKIEDTSTRLPLVYDVRSAIIMTSIITQLSSRPLCSDVSTPPLPTMEPSSPRPPTAKRKLIGFKQRIELNEQRARENAGKPDNIVSRKGFVV